MAIFLSCSSDACATSFLSVVRSVVVAFLVELDLLSLMLILAAFNLVACCWHGSLDIEFRAVVCNCNEDNMMDGTLTLLLLLLNLFL